MLKIHDCRRTEMQSFHSCRSFKGNLFLWITSFIYIRVLELSQVHVPLLVGGII
ncbi:hypothetical protein QJS04_geneDACA015116 [Acorus gramineus]|uniref:Uncharacterized protein n=1 Tax=Acorus gramineus TaxID=55184 RepID=A0AAV9BW17_ACOGR|nr:hypothetical protein QJS04_geneDACA015116 [Acorus gramineus]